MSISGVLLGLVNIGIVVVLLLIIGAVALWIGNMLGASPPADLKKLFLVLVALVALYMLIALIFGLPTFTVWR